MTVLGQELRQKLGSSSTIRQEFVTAQVAMEVVAMTPQDEPYDIGVGSCSEYWPLCCCQVSLKPYLRPYRTMDGAQQKTQDPCGTEGSPLTRKRFSQDVGFRV